jgi:hypothetical protein
MRVVHGLGCKIPSRFPTALFPQMREHTKLRMEPHGGEYKTLASRSS